MKNTQWIEIVERSLIGYGFLPKDAPYQTDLLGYDQSPLGDDALDRVQFFSLADTSDIQKPKKPPNYKTLSRELVVRTKKEGRVIDDYRGVDDGKYDAVIEWFQGPRTKQEVFLNSKRCHLNSKGHRMQDPKSVIDIVLGREIYPLRISGEGSENPEDYRAFNRLLLRYRVLGSQIDFDGKMGEDDVEVRGDIHTRDTDGGLPDQSERAQLSRLGSMVFQRSDAPRCIWTPPEFVGDYIAIVRRLATSITRESPR